jgi:hypothetical protein
LLGIAAFERGRKAKIELSQSKTNINIPYITATKEGTSYDAQNNALRIGEIDAGAHRKSRSTMQESSATQNCRHPILPRLFLSVV